MRQVVFPNMAIISATTGAESDVNEKVNRNLILREKLEASSFDFQGVVINYTENCAKKQRNAFLVVADTEDALEHLTVMAKEFEQRALWYIPSDRSVFFICTDSGNRTEYGNLVNISQALTKACDHYIMVPEKDNQKKYFAIKEKK